MSQNDPDAIQTLDNALNNGQNQTEDTEEPTEEPTLQDATNQTTTNPSILPAPTNTVPTNVVPTVVQVVNPDQRLRIEPFVMTTKDPVELSRQLDTWLEHMDVELAFTKKITPEDKLHAFLAHAGPFFRKMYKKFAVKPPENSTDIYQDFIGYIRLKLYSKEYRYKWKKDFHHIGQRQNETFMMFQIRLEEIADKAYPDPEENEKMVLEKIALEARDEKIRFKAIGFDTLAQFNEWLITYSEVKAESRAVDPDRTSNVRQVRKHHQSRDNLPRNKKFQNKSSKSKPKNYKSQKPKSDSRSDSKKLCLRCGSDEHLANDDKCPAWGKTCSFCGTEDHFQRVCLKKRNEDSNSTNGNYKKPNPRKNVKQVNKKPSTSDPKKEVDSTFCGYMYK